MYAQTTIDARNELQNDWWDRDNKDCDPAIEKSWITSVVFDNSKSRALSEKRYNVDEPKRYKDYSNTHIES